MGVLTEVLVEQVNWNSEVDWKLKQIDRLFMASWTLDKIKHAYRLEMHVEENGQRSLQLLTLANE